MQYQSNYNTECQASPSGHFPHLDGLVPRGAEEVVTGGHKGDRGDVVVVAMHGLDTLIGGKVPQFDGHVSTT